MNGRVLADTPIAVDRWRLRECPHARVFFLTHMHADHTAGLTSAWHLPFYCSHVTKALVVEKFGIAEHLIHAFDLDSSYTIWLDQEKEEMMTVNFIDANHCPGAVMILFQGYFGTFLYTGDFRYCDRMLLVPPLLGCPTVDRLYLDNTYCDPACQFGTRDAAIAKMVQIIGDHQNFRVLIGVRGLGKESLLESLAITLQTRVVVLPRHLQVLQLLHCLDVFTTCKDEGFLYAVSMDTITARKLAEWNDVHPTIAIIPTALFWGRSQFHQTVPGIFVVPYSDHSPYNDLQEFVCKLAPRRVLPIVTVSAGLAHRTNMSCFNSHLESSPCLQFEIPASVRRWMNCRDMRLSILQQPQQQRISSCSSQAHNVTKGVMYTDDTSREESNNLHSKDIQPLVEFPLSGGYMKQVVESTANKVAKTAVNELPQIQRTQVEDVIGSNSFLSAKQIEATAISSKQGTVIASSNATRSLMSADDENQCPLETEYNMPLRNSTVKQRRGRANKKVHRKGKTKVGQSSKKDCSKKYEKAFEDSTLGLKVISVVSISNSEFINNTPICHTDEGIHSQNTSLQQVTDAESMCIPVLKIDHGNDGTSTEIILPTCETDVVDADISNDPKTYIPVQTDETQMTGTSSLVVNDNNVPQLSNDAKITVTSTSIADENGVPLSTEATNAVDSDALSLAADNNGSAASCNTEVKELHTHASTIKDLADDIAITGVSTRETDVTTPVKKGLALAGETERCSDNAMNEADIIKVDSSADVAKTKGTNGHVSDGSLGTLSLANNDGAKSCVLTSRELTSLCVNRYNRNRKTRSLQVTADSTGDSNRQITARCSSQTSNYSTLYGQAEQWSTLDNVLFSQKVWQRRQVVCERNLMFLQLLMPLLDEQVAKREADS